MKTLFLGALIVFLSARAQADTAESVVASAESLGANGVTIHRIQHATPLASVEIDVTLSPDGRLGHFELIECIVLKNEVPDERLKDLDAGVMDADVVARRNKSLKTHSVFLVLGKEVSRSYLAFEFSNETKSSGKQVIRYLLPAAAVKKTKPTPSLEETPAQ